MILGYISKTDLIKVKKQHMKFYSCTISLLQCKEGISLKLSIQYLTFPAMTITVGLGWFSNWFDGEQNTGLDWLYQVLLQIVSSCFQWNKT